MPRREHDEHHGGAQEPPDRRLSSLWRRRPQTTIYDAATSNPLVDSPDESALIRVPLDVYTPRNPQKPLYYSPEPKVLFTKAAQPYERHITSDLTIISSELMRLGFDQQTANSFAITIHGPHEERPRGAQDMMGWYWTNSPGIVRKSDGFRFYHPLAVDVVITEEAALNKALWHELKHAERDKIQHKEPKIDYLNPRAQRIARRAGIGGFVGGAASLFEMLNLYSHHTGNPAIDIGGMAVGTLIAGVGISTAGAPQATVQRLDREERVANRYMRRQARRGLTPLSFV